ncbi:MAG: hypothetical protein WBD47_10400, partial [Phormidesmis sp.]
MKYWKLLALCLLGIVAAVAIANLRPLLYPTPDVSKALAAQFSEGCLLPEQAARPVWECYEISLDEPAHKAVIVKHEGGTEFQVLTFQENGQTKFRFTPTEQGVWSFSTGGEISINADRPAYAKGFVGAQGSKWIREATGEAFVPQFVMYDKPDLDVGLDEFVENHGFTGFHITNLRDFLENPSYFEAVVLKTYRRGGATHFWIWGDESRRETPTSYGVDADLLYTEIAARLAPLPGWSVGYGFDLFEWASDEEIEQFRSKLREGCSYYHMVGGRGHKNKYQEISSNLDYASWEWHQPDYQDYRDHLSEADGRPAFSEDRFRIRVPSRYPEKDYDFELTRRGLWHSAMAGGVANIWGYKPEDKEFSEPYSNREAIATYSRFIDDTFSVQMEPDNDLIDQGYCLRDRANSAICYVEQAQSVTLNLQ